MFIELNVDEKILIKHNINYVLEKNKTTNVADS